MVGPAAHDAPATGSPIRAGGVYHSSDPTGADGDILDLLADVAGRLKVVGAAAEDAAVVGFPVQVGGRYDAAARDLDDGDVGAVAVDDLARLLVNLGWSPSLQADEAANDSDKSFTVPADTEWRVKSIWVEYTSSGDAGNRQLAVDIQDGGADVIAQVRTGLVQAASLTRYYLFAPHVTELTAFRDTDYLSTIMPEWVLPAGYVVRVWDKDAIAAAADDVVIQLMVEARTV